MWTVPGAEAEKVFGWAELNGGYVIQLSKVGGVVASYCHIAAAQQTQCTHAATWSGAGSSSEAGVAAGWPELSQTLHRDPAPALAQPFSRKFM